MITPSFSTTATERVLPKLALDFTTATLDPRVTFTRSTDATHPATYINSNGLITVATNDQPRFDYDPVTLACKGLLIEESRFNLLTQSGSFSGWSTSNASLSVSAALSPDGISYLIALTESSSAAAVHQTFTSFTSTTAGTLSCFVKANTRSYITLSVNNGTSNQFVRATFNLTNGTLGSSSAGTGSVIGTNVENFGNGVYRCSLAYSLTGAVNVNISMATSANPTVDSFGRETYAGNGTSNVYIWGAQLESGAFATSYIPTTSAALTRNADVATMTGTNFSDWYNASEGSFVTQSIAKPESINGTTTFMMYASATDFCGFAPPAVNQGRLLMRTAAGFTVNISKNPMPSTSIWKQAAGLKTDNAAYYVNGAVVNTDTSATMCAPTTASIGCQFGSSDFCNTHIQKISYWPQRLTNAELAAFSSL